MNIVTIHQKPGTTRSPRPRGDVKSAPKPPAWRPQASGLSREELRQIVLETLG